MRAKHVAHLNLEAVSASTPYILVDLSDSTNFPHTPTSEIHVIRLYITWEQQTDGVYDVFFGVVTENDATDGSAKFFYCLHLETVDNPTDSTGRGHVELNGEIDLVVANGNTPRLASNSALADNAAWKNDVLRTTPLGTAYPGVGDFVMYVEEVSGTGTLDLSVTAIYETA